MVLTAAYMSGFFCSALEDAARECSQAPTALLSHQRAPAAQHPQQYLGRQDLVSVDLVALWL